MSEVMLRPHRPGDLGWAVHRQAILYHQEYGWTIAFEGLLAEIAASFIRDFDAASECAWIAERDGDILGAIFVVRADDATAKIRMLYVEPTARGQGVGHRLVDAAIAFARGAGYRRVTLWTNDVLTAARAIYVKAGFRLVAEERHHSFGHDLVGQNWGRPCRPSAIDGQPERAPRAGARMNDSDFMRRAIEMARRGDLSPGKSPIGCVIVRGGRILAEGCNEVDLRHDPTAHAEMVTIRRACAALDESELRDATLYSTLQPCGMCSMASIWAKIGRIVYGAERHQVHEMYFEDRHFDTMDFIRDAFKDDIELRGGVLGEACAELYVGPHEAVPEPEQVNL